MRPQVRKNAEQAAAYERRALLGSPDPLERQRRLESEADLAGAAQDITASLQRTRQQMTQARRRSPACLQHCDQLSEKWQLERLRAWL